MELSPLSQRTENILIKGNLEFFGNDIIYKGDGRSIPFITLFSI